MRKSIYLFLITVIIATSMVTVSCGGADITGSFSNENIGEDINGGGNGGDVDNGGGEDNSGGETPTPDDNYTLPNDNPSDYYRIRVPFGVNSGEGYIDVSYKDTNKLRQLWFDQINRKAANDGKVFAIRNKANNRDANNFQNNHKHGNYSAQDYYYFNENGDIVYKEDNTIIKKFVGAIITEYRDVTIKNGHRANFGFNDNRQAIDGHGGITWKQKGIYTLGAIYANALTTEEARSKYAGDNPFKYGVFDFITYRNNIETFHNGISYKNNIFERQYINPGFIEVLVMYDYNNMGYSGAAAVHSYYAYYGIYNYHEEYKNHPGVYFTPENMIYMTNQDVYLRQRPEYTTKQLNHTAVFTDSHRSRQFLFMPGHAN